MRNRRYAVRPLLGCLALSLLAAACPAGAEEPEAPSIEPNFLTNIRQVTDGFEKAGEGYFSPDGKKIIYQAVRREYPFYQIYTQPLEDGRPQLISPGRGRTTCSYFSPDGTKLMFSSSHADPKLYETEKAERDQQEEDRKSGVRRRYSWPFDEHMDIYETDLNGQILKKLTDAPGYDAEGAYSSDGKKIAFCSTRDGDPDLYLMNADGTDVTQLTNAEGYDGGPFISPDGKWVVFRSDRKQKDYLQIYVIGVDGKHETALTDSNGVNWGPYWHPTQPYLIWSGADHSNPRARPNYDLWLAKYEVKDGQFSIGEPQRVTDFAGADVLPVFSPDGKKLMWTSTRTEDHSSQLYIADFQLP
ncbi:TolB family protein [Lignipirellula cremea]|uniref:Translocation protein TolB n=1 Tax=Lignipirellula cremea TaxID=2528010 RepID=A0A518E2U3_9BACT|nr:PD40 domain-containing protein [Lignipirellula cremea]QDU98409.1 translocation protein TolB [Lignipirellula cremea]